MDGSCLVTPSQLVGVQATALPPEVVLPRGFTGGSSHRWRGVARQAKGSTALLSQAVTVPAQVWGPSLSLLLCVTGVWGMLGAVEVGGPTTLTAAVVDHNTVVWGESPAEQCWQCS
jgi:hypothetical protein